MTKEKFDIVNPDDTVIAVVQGKERLHKSAAIHRSVHVFIDIVGGGFLIQKKAEGTENGGKWSSAVSGHVRSGETYSQAAIRECEEEIGIKFETSNLERINKVYPNTDNGLEFSTLFRALIDLDKVHPTIACDEVDELMILPIRDIIIDVSKHMYNKYSKAFISMLNIYLTF